ncbi:hypothetical protein JJ691_27880 [Kutzneria sp. CA-103260]|nr:hypothetical protein JJ691_27880 [Kutzneria sp. CA-103260]
MQLTHMLTTRASGDKQTADGDFFVDQCERVISAENEAWMAKWSAPGESRPQSHRIHETG